MVDHIMMYSENCFRTFYETIKLEGEKIAPPLGLQIKIPVGSGRLNEDCRYCMTRDLSIKDAGNRDKGLGMHWLSMGLSLGSIVSGHVVNRAGTMRRAVAGALIAGAAMTPGFTAESTDGFSFVPDGRKAPSCGGCPAPVFRQASARRIPLHALHGRLSSPPRST